MKLCTIIWSCLLLIDVLVVEGTDKTPPKSAFFGQSFNSGYNTGFSGGLNMGYGNNNNNNNNFHRGGNNFNQRPNTGYGMGQGNQVFCPNQTFYDDQFMLSGIAIGYPVQAITTELVNRPQLAACLSRSATLDTAPQVPAIDPNLGHVKETCPNVVSRLYSYVAGGGLTGRCWVLQNFQEPTNFVVCLTHFCKRCSNTNHFNNNVQSRCIKTYRYVGVYAYCENLAVNSRIVYQRIIIPDHCSCKSVYCYPNWH